MPTRSENPVKNWLSDEYAWLGFIMTAMVGGLVGYIKHYEQTAVESTWQSKCWAIARRVFMAGFAGWLLYQFSIEYHISNAWAHIMSGITGMFAAEAFEVLWTVVRARLLAISGTKEK